MDHFFYFSSCKQKAQHALRLAEAECSRIGFPTHEAVSAEGCVTVLGWQIDGGLREIRQSLKRSWRLWMALDHILARGRLWSSQLEVVLGRFTFLALLCRPALSLMHSVYSYVRQGFPSGAPI